MREHILMMTVRRLVKLAGGALVGLLMSTQGAWGAASCVSAASASWNVATTWTGCAGGNGAVTGTPGSADTVTIGAAHTVTVDANSAALSLTINVPSVATQGVTINGTNTLMVTGAVTLPSVFTIGRTSSVIVGAGTLNAASIAIPGGGVNRISQVTVSTGTITTTGSITFSGSANFAQFISTGASTVNVGGNFTSGGTLTTSNTGTINFNGAGAQNIGIYTTYNNVTINKSAGTATLLGNTSMTGALTVTAGTLAVTTFTLGVAGNLTVNGAVTGTTAVITLSGNGTNIDGTGSITTTTGALTITAAKSILAAANLTIASPIAITGAVTVTNTGTVTSTAATGITGSAPGSTWTNAANSTLNVSGPLLTTGTLTASANPNTVNYAGAAQTVKVPSGGPATYYHLTLGGSGAKTMLATAMTVAGNFTMSGAAATSATATAALTVGGNFTLAASNTFSAGTFSHSVGGNWSNSGTFTASTGTVTLTGTNSTLGGSVATTFNNLIVNKTASNNVSIVCATPSPTVNATLTLTSGDIVTSGANPGCATTCATQVPIIVAAAGTIAGGSSTSYVQGALRKMFSAAGTLNFRATAGQDEFPVGDTTNYSPIEITAGTTSTAGSVTACVTPTDHPQVTTPVSTTGINAAKSVNRYWSLTTATINTTAVLVDATFKFVATDVDAGATTANFIVEDYGTYWSPTTLVAAGTTSTQAKNIDLTSAINDIAIGEPLSGFTALPGRYNAFETATPAGAIIGKIQTKVAGTGFQVDVVNINANKTGVLAAAITVEVRLLDSSGGGVLDVNDCNAAWPLIQALSNFAIPASGRGTIPAVTVANSYRSVRFQIRSPAGGPYTQIGCSTDLFAIRPASITITALDATSLSAGTSRALANVTASGGIVHRAGTAASPLSFTLRATPVPATATLYDGSPSIVAGFPTCGTLCTTVGTLSFTAGSWTGAGVRENATANYSEVGTFNLQLEDATYASVDAVDGTPLATLKVPVTASVQIGRFVPDHFDVTGSNTPTFKTFNVANGVCSTPPSGPNRSFTYIGQPFGYLTAPAGTILARNAAGATTVNYTGTLWKFSGTSSAAKDCTTNPNICQFTTSFTGTGVASSVVSNYTYALTPVSTPGWDNSAAVAAVVTVTPGVGTGTGTFVISSSDALAFLRNPATPQPSFTAAITDTFSVTDSSEVAGDSNNGTISTTTALVFNGGGSGIAFDAGNEFRYGRLKLSNAYGSELLDLPMPLAAQYWNGTIFVTNAADNCATLNVANIALGNYQGGITSSNLPTGNISFTGPFVSGMGNLKLTKPTPTPASKGSVDVTVNLGAGGENKLYLQGNWTGATYIQNPTAPATFGIFKSPLIYRRENY